MQPPFINDPEFPAHIRHRQYNSIPHIDGNAYIQHITYCLADSVPVKTLHQLSRQCQGIPDERERQLSRRMFIDRFMDSGYGSCILQIPEIASMIIENWKFFDGVRYGLLSYVVMPNHCHVLIQKRGTAPLPRIVHSWKSFTARKINIWTATHGRSPNIRAGSPVWQRDYWDRYIRNTWHLVRVIEYIEQNPVKAGLVRNPQDWVWSSASG